MKAQSATLLALAGTALLLSACRSTRATLVEEWRTSLAAMTLRPVYPPREDFQVGDVYLYRPADDEAAAEDWLATLDLRDEAVAFQAKRSPFPNKEARQAGGRRVRQVVFPEFAGVSARGTNLEWLVPSEALSIAGGESWEGGHEISLKIASAESLGLPFSLVSQALVEEVQRDGRTVQQLRGEVGISPTMLKRTHVDPRRARMLTDRENDFVQLEVVTEVYYAHAVDVTVSQTDYADGRKSREIQPVDASAQPDNKSLVEALNLRVDGIQSTTPGVDLEVLGANDATVVLRRTYAQPIAIAYKSVVVTLDRRTGEVLSYEAPEDAVRPTRKKKADAFDLEAALALELADHLHGKGELVAAGYDADVERWIVEVQLPAGADEPFVHYSERVALAERVRARASRRLSRAEEERLQRFVEAGGILFR